MQDLSLVPNSACYNDLMHDQLLHLQRKDTKKSLKTRIQGLALDKIQSEDILGHLISSSIETPAILNDYLKIQKKKSKIPKIDKILNAPIGIKSNPYCFWINAFLQFVIFIPSLRYLFSKKVNNFLCIKNFIDFYLQDVKSNLLVTKASTMCITECIARKIPNTKMYLDQIADLFSILMEMQCIISKDDKSIAFKTHQIQIEDENIFFEKYLIQKIKEHKLDANPSNELVVNFNWFLQNKKNINCKPVLHFFIEDSSNVISYELDAFIEYKSYKGCDAYITYIKKNDIWYRCLDASIKKVKVDSLQKSLKSSFLFHYTRNIKRYFNDYLI